MFAICTGVFATVLPWLVAVVLSRRGAYRFYAGWINGALFGSAGYAIGREWAGVAGGILSAVIATVCWWLSRRRRKRAPRAYGAKSRALLAAVVAKLREATKPRPVFKPVPGRA